MTLPALLKEQVSFNEPSARRRITFVPGVVPDIPAPTPVEVRTGTGGVGGALAGVNDGQPPAPSPQPQVAELVDVAGLIPYRPSGDGVRDVVAVPDHDVFGVKAGFATAVGAGKSKYTF